MSDANKGDNNPMFGKSHSDEIRAKMCEVQQQVDRSGAKNPMYGKVPANAMTINVYSLDNVLVRSFTSQVAAANWVNIPSTTFQRYLRSGKVWNNLHVSAPKIYSLIAVIALFIYLLLRFIF